MKKNIQKLSFIIGVIALAGCGGNGNGDHTVASIQDAVPATDTTSKEQTVFYNLPSPLETFTVLKMTGANFDKSLLNPVDKITKYSSSASKAVNLGIYSTDLSFSFMYKQNQEANLYLKNISELTASLGVDGSYGQAVYKRMQANENNLDSLMQIVSEATVNTDIYLKENQRNSTVVLIAAGAWLESLHIIANTAAKMQKEEITALVADQRIAIQPLLKMLEQHQSDPDVAAITTDIKALSDIYESLQPGTLKASATVSAEKDVKSVGDDKSYSLSKEQLQSILTKTETLRTKFTN